VPVYPGAGLADTCGVFTWIAVTAAAVGVMSLARWALRRVDRLGRPRPFPAISVGVTTALTLAAGVPAVLHARLEHRLARVASELVGSPVTVHCQTFGQTWTDAHTELGYVRFGADGRPEKHTVLAWEACRSLQGWERSGYGATDLDQVIAVHVLTHESMHMAGTLNEAETECYAVQRDVWTATALGADRTQARQLARRYWQEVYPRMPDDYRSAACTPGGQFDQHLPEPPWA
jgi:hypothetical protein